MRAANEKGPRDAGLRRSRGFALGIRSPSARQNPASPPGSRSRAAACRLPCASDGLLQLGECHLGFARYRRACAARRAGLVRRRKTLEPLLPDLLREYGADRLTESGVGWRHVDLTVKRLAEEGIDFRTQAHHLLRHSSWGRGS